ncbi:hypothetical protein CPC16_009147 [Podila verticillata]|nr:hypothetical protein CPC16_009147 [Podila verticillata]KAI9238923.1 MAG: hypothetical protein BYD32DRAFT_460254 [Podila humilis]KFH66459.1 hypothetical protein MVEG_06984 [Podila verticillata NRRL 6337]
MKTIAFIAALCLTSFAQVQAQPQFPTNLFFVAPTNCGFYAGVSYMPPTNRQRHCQVSVEVRRPNNQGSPCVARANKFLDNSRIAANKCAVFIGKKCHKTDKMPYGQICLGRAGRWKSDQEVTAMLRNCMAYATGQVPSYPWKITCGEGPVPDYGRFTPYHRGLAIL